MTTFLFVLALVAQTADGVNTCRGINQGAAREANPLMPHSCAGVVAVKSAYLGAALALPHKRLTFGAIAAGGAIGFTLSVKTK